ncbi:MAG: hypothetical protein ACTHK6_13350 [Solirubrobacterales bacterium]
MADIHESRDVVKTLEGRRIESSDLEQQEGDIYLLLLRLDDGSVVHVEAWGNSEAAMNFGVPPTTRWGLNLWRFSPEEVAEIDREVEDAEGFDD